MVAVSGGLIFLGYQLLTYGWSQVNGSNAGFFDILWPGRFTGANPDKASTGTETSTGLTNIAQGGTIANTAEKEKVLHQLAGQTVLPFQKPVINP